MTGAQVVVVDDHELLAESLCVALGARGLQARALRPTSTEAVIAAVLDERPAVVLLDLQLGGGIGSGLTLIGPLTDAGTRVLVVSGETDEAVVGEALEAGALGYVCKAERFEALLGAAERAARGGEVMTPERRAVLVNTARRHRAETAAAEKLRARLTPREEQVLEALCAGDAVTAIATGSFVSVPTVRTQVRAILMKLGVSSQLEAVAVAHRHGWFDARHIDRSA